MNTFAARTGLSYLVCPEIPGDENTDNGIIAAGHRAFKYYCSMNKPVYPAYNGHLNSSAQVTISDFRILINQDHAELFKNFCATGKVFEKMTVYVLSSFGTGDNLAQPKLSFELDQARIASATANVPFTQYDFTGPGPQTSNLIQGDGRLDPRAYSSKDLRHFKASQLYLLEVGIVYDQATVIYYPVGTDGTKEGQLATTFVISSNKISS